MHYTQISSFGDCALDLAPAPSTMAREAPSVGSADCIENTQCAPSA